MTAQLDTVRKNAEALELGTGALNANTPKGEHRVTIILDAARHELVEHGHGGLTLDAVAERAGIRKGNLQYYFPTRAALLRATFARELERHALDWLAARDDGGHDAGTRLKRLVRFELAMNRDAAFIRQVRERWSLEVHDPKARELTVKWYGWITQRYAEIISAIRPDMVTGQARQCAALVYAMLVGSTPYFDPASLPANTEQGFETAIEKAVFQLVDAR